MRRVDSLEKKLWCWEGLGTGGEGDGRGWDGWMASPILWTWVWVNSRCWWWKGRPGVLRFMGLQRVGHDWATELNWTDRASPFLAAKNRINLISVLTIWWCPCVESSLVCWKTMFTITTAFSCKTLLLAFALLHSVFQGQIGLLLQVFLDFLLLVSSPL